MCSLSGQDSGGTRLLEQSNQGSGVPRRDCNKPGYPHRGICHPCCPFLTLPVLKELGLTWQHATPCIFNYLYTPGPEAFALFAGSNMLDVLLVSAEGRGGWWWGNPDGSKERGG